MFEPDDCALMAGTGEGTIKGGVRLLAQKAVDGWWLAVQCFCAPLIVLQFVLTGHGGTHWSVLLASVGEGGGRFLNRLRPPLSLPEAVSTLSVCMPEVPDLLCMPL